MKYAAETERTVDGTVFTRVDLPEMEHAPTIVVALPVGYIEEEKRVACEAQLDEMKQIVLTHDTREATFDSGYERISLAEAEALRRQG